MSEYDPPREIVPIFNPFDWIFGGEEALTVAEGDGRYLKLTGGVEKGPVTFNQDITIKQDINFVNGANTASIGIDGGGDLAFQATGSVNMNGLTIDMTGGEIHKVPLIHGQNNVDLVVEGKGTGDVVLKTNNLNRVVVQDNGNIAMDTNVLFVDGVNNRVGVGTATPSSTLDVSGNAVVSGNLTVDTTTLVADATNNRVGIVRTPTTTNLEVNGGGSVEGLWIVNNTRSNLHLGNGIFDNSTQRLSLTQNGTSNQMYWTGNGDLNFAVGTAPAIRYVMNGNNGRFGIYDTTGNAITPERALHIRGDAIRLDRSGQSPNIQLHQYAGGGYSTIQKGFAILVASVGVNDGQFQIQDYGTAVSGGGTTRFSIANNGSVGIGSSSPNTNFQLDTLTGFIRTRNICFKVYKDSPAQSVNPNTPFFLNDAIVSFDYFPSTLGSFGFQTSGSYQGMYRFPLSGVYQVQIMVRFTDTTGGDRGLVPKIYNGSTYSNIISMDDGTVWCPTDGSTTNRRVLCYTDMILATQGNGLVATTNANIAYEWAMMSCSLVYAT